MDARKGAYIFQFSWATGTTLLRLSIPYLSLWDVGGTKVATTVIDGGMEGPGSLER